MAPLQARRQWLTLRATTVARTVAGPSVRLLRRSPALRAVARKGREARAAARRTRAARLRAQQRDRVRRTGPEWLFDLLTALDGLPAPRRVVLILGPDGAEAAAIVAGHLAQAQVRLLTSEPVAGDRLHPRVRSTVAGSIEERIAAFGAMDVPDLVVEHAGLPPGAARACFRRLFPFLAPDGHYLVDVGPESPQARAGGLDLRQLLIVLDDIAHAPGRQPPPEQAHQAGLADAVRSVDLGPRFAVVTKRGRHRLKLREATANEVLARRGSRWGSVLEVVPPRVLLPQVVMRHHGGTPALPHRDHIEVPELCLREYRDVSVTALQVVYDDKVYFPDTFRHHQMAWLSSHSLVNVDDYTARLRWAPAGRRRRLDGHYFYFDTEFPGHFGHVVTEALGRAWGWHRALERYPDIRPLVSLKRDQSEIPGYQRELFRSLGIDPDTVEYVRARTAVTVESLVAATPGFTMPGYAAPELAEVWREMGRRMAPAPVAPTPRLFVSRRPSTRRHCRSTTEVEEFFAAEGFAVVYPEDHPFTDQVAMFRSAEVVAGFAGSGMFTMMFSDVRRRILVTSSSYTANNEFLIASVQGGTLDLFWGPADVPRPEDAFSLEAFQSNYDFDVAANADALRRAIRG